MNNKTIKVIIADDHTIVLDGLEALIKTTDDIKVIGRAHNGHHALQILDLNQPDVDVVVLDIDMPVMDGLEATRKIKDAYPDIKVLILTMHNKESFIKEIITIGASGYILKNRGSNELLSAIRAVYNGGEYFGKSVTDTLIQSIQNQKKVAQQITTKLTKRETEVLRLIGAGLTTKKISGTLNIADSTVETHRRNLIDKLGVGSTKGLVRYAVEHDILPNK